MPVQLYPTKQQLSDLAIIRSIGGERLQKVIDKIDSLDPGPIRLNELRAAFKSVLLSETDSEIVLRQLVSLYTLRRRRNLTEDEVFEGLSFGIQINDFEKWSESEIKEWEAIQPQLKKLMDIPAIWTVIKALDISYEYTNLLQSLKIITDIRPVFDKSGDNINGAVISHNLRIHFDKAGRNENITFALDQKDIQNLKNSCERALKKAKAAKELMQSIDKIDERVIICGEEDSYEEI